MSLAVLVVEDDRIAQQIAKNLIEELGHQPTFVQSGKEALEQLTTKSYDLLVLDLGLPDIDGMTLTKLVRDVLGSQIYIIGLSALVDSQRREQCLANGMNDLVAKPLTLEYLDNLLQKLID